MGRWWYAWWLKRQGLEPVVQRPFYGCDFPLPVGMEELPVKRKAPR